MKTNITFPAYNYYRHGPLQRTVLGQLNVQGIDYAYTLQGWLKGVNSTTLNPDFDMGEDGKTGSPVARDVYSFGLHYFDNGATDYDYKNVGTVNPFIRPMQTGYKSLYNGNIAAMSVNLGALKQAEGLGVYNDALLYNYRYDQLNRIKELQAYNGLNISTNAWSPTGINDYKELISYDPNGNILTYLRNGSTAGGLAMDNMTYHYNTGNNQLNHVTDLVPSGNYSVDIDNQSNNNYEYDAIGNLIKDNAEGISSITWNVYGKISSITKTSGTISYTYDATGNRITKTVGGVTTLYVRDASGNVMSVYEIPAANTIIQKELHIYGSGRLGMVTGELEYVDVSLSPEFGQGKIVSFIRGKKYFELSNHLGNVMAVVSDKRLSVTGGVYEADIVSATDYAPFGMGLVGRSYSSEEYRYGFQSQEKVNDIAGIRNHYTALFWEYDSRLGIRWNIDPKYTASESRYATFGNNPIFYTDPLGDFKTRVGAWMYKITHGGGNIGRDTKSGQYFVGKKVEFKGEGGGISFKRTFDWNGRGSPYDGSGWGHQTRSFIANVLSIKGKSDNIFSVGINSILQNQSVELTGALLDKVKNDPAIIAMENTIVSTARNDSRYGKEEFSFQYSEGLQLGGKRGSLNPLSKESAATWKVAGNPLTWVVRSVHVHATVQVNTEGAMNINYQFVDNLDLRPEKDGKIFFGGLGNSPFSSESGNRPWEYNAVSSFLGVPYHDMVGGNDKMKIKATWTSQR